MASFGGRKVRALLRILVTHRGRFLPHEVLAERLWPDRLPADPAANLQVLVNRARRAVGRGDLILTGPGGYALTAEPWLVVDVDQYLEDLRRCAGLSGETAVRAYRETLAVSDAEPLAEDRYASGQLRTWMRSARRVSPLGSVRRPWPWSAANRLRRSSGPGPRTGPNRCGRWLRWRWCARWPRPVILLRRCRLSRRTAGGWPRSWVWIRHRRRRSSCSGCCAPRWHRHRLRRSPAASPSSPSWAVTPSWRASGAGSDRGTGRRWSPSPAPRARASPDCWPRWRAPARPSASRRSGPTGTSLGRWDGLCSASWRRPTTQPSTPCPTSCGARWPPCCPI